MAYLRSLELHAGNLMKSAAPWKQRLHPRLCCCEVHGNMVWLFL